MDFLIGTPYSFRDFNCWHYVSKVRADNNIKTKLFKPRNMANAFQIIKAEMQVLGHGLTRATSPENFDIVIVKSGKIYHCGLYYEKEVMHCSRALRQVVKESFNDFTSAYEEYSLWR